jgi:ADP-heptose:LPS heptosyltransferase
MRTLALVPGGISDQFLFFPTLSDIQRLYPNAHIDVITEPQSVAAYRVCQDTEKAVAFDFGDRNSLADWGNLLGVMREKEYDAVISLNNSWGMGLVLWLTGIPNRIAYDGPANPFLTQRIPKKTGQYKADMFHDLLAGLDIHQPSPALNISVPRKDIDWAEAEQKRLGLNGGYILVDGRTESSDPKDNYPVNSWKLALQAILERQPGTPIVVVQEEGQTLAQDLSDAGIAVKASEPTDLGKLGAMIAAANLLISTYQASLHLAVAVGTFSVGLFGTTDPKNVLPANDKFVGLSANTGNAKDIEPQKILETLMGNAG